jgi:long-chain acyl-CoA synthetase
MMTSFPEFNRPKSRYTNNLVDSMKMNLAKCPDMMAVICGNRSATWAQIWERTNRLSNGLFGLGVKQGDRVALLLKNCFEFPESFVSSTKSGFVLSPVNFNLTGDEITYQLNDCGASAVIANSEFCETLLSIRTKVPTLNHIVVVGDCSFSGIVSYEGLIEKSSPEDLNVNISPNDIHMILYTSGTTGKPKGAVRGYMEDYHTGMTVCVEWKIRNGDVQLAVAPLYHAGPCAWFCATLVSGGTLVVVPAFLPDKVLEAVETYNVNWMMMVPVMYDRMLSMPDEILAKYDKSSLRTVISGGAPLHTSTKLKIKKFFVNTELNEFYGSTELGVSTTLRDGDQLKKERSVGRPLQDLEIKLVDRNGLDVSVGEVGLLYSRGRSEERRVGKECRRLCRSRWSPYH